MDKKNTSRKENSIRNIMYGIGGQLLSNFLSFINRTVFINTIGVTYLGISGLFTNIFSFLSFAELGIGSAIAYSLYEPLAKNDEEKICALMKWYKRAYEVIGLIIAGVGISLVPILPDLIKGRPDVENLSIYYLIMLGTTVASYFFTYKRTIILCDQKAYINSRNTYIFSSAQMIVQVALLILFKNYILYLIVAGLFTVASNIAISLKADQLYPYLKKKTTSKIDVETSKTIRKNVAAMVLHKISGIIVYSSDNVIISKFIGLLEVGIYSNYYMVITVLTNLLGQVFTAITASVANLQVLTEKEVVYKKFQGIYFLNFWIVTVFTTCLYVLWDDFIRIWLGDDFLMDHLAVVVLVFWFYNQSMRHTVGVFKNSAGLYWNDRYKPLAESIINLVTSIILLKFFGIAGVFMGTVISLMTTSFWVEPYIIYKHIFKIKLRTFFISYFKYMAVCFGIVVITSFVTGLLPEMNFFIWVLKGIISVIFSSFGVFAIFRNTMEFKEALPLLEPVKNKLKGLKRH